MASLKTYQLSHVPSSHVIYVGFFRGVRNAAFLREQLLSGNAEYEYAFIDAASIVSAAHVLAAAYRALNDLLNDRLKTRNVHSEIVFSLSSNNNITESFRRFGVNETTKDLIAVKVPASTGRSQADVQNHLCDIIEGTICEFDDETLQETTDWQRVKKTYKLSALNHDSHSQKKRKGKTEENKEPDRTSTAAADLPEKQELEIAILGMMALKGTT
ncbi:MAG: hypothetical protein M1819_004964 [Sarea resinae]|nr:MAG: hypothetical protein M1819_004964 [Sarea resinae]